MQWFRLRPTFVIQLDGSRAETIEKLRAQRDLSRSDMTFLMFGEYGEFHLPPAQHRLWSPHLSFYIADAEPDTDSPYCIIRGLYAPRVEVWTVLWIFYLAMSFTVFFGLIIGCSQWMLGEVSWGFGLAIFGILSVVAIYVTAHLGQQWSMDQMHLLRERLDQTLISAGVRCQSEIPAEPSSFLGTT